MSATGIAPQKERGKQTALIRGSSPGAPHRRKEYAAEHARAMQILREGCAQTGWSDFVMKPLNLRRLDEALESLTDSGSTTHVMGEVAAQTYAAQAHIREKEVGPASFNSTLQRKVADSSTVAETYSAHRLVQQAEIEGERLIQFKEEVLELNPMELMGSE